MIELGIVPSWFRGLCYGCERHNIYGICFTEQMGLCERCFLMHVRAHSPDTLN